MPINHTVRQGECISSIAQKYGHLPDVIWNDGANAALKAERKDANVLFPGDVLVIPDKRSKDESCATDAQHQFVRKAVPAKLRLRFLDNDKPIKNEAYELNVDGKTIKGNSDGDGWIEASIPPSAKEGTVFFGQKRRVFKLKFGCIDPYDKVSGAQMRLKNLWYYTGDADGVLNDQTKDSVKSFQKKASLTENGQLDDATKNELKNKHGG